MLDSAMFGFPENAAASARGSAARAQSAASSAGRDVRALEDRLERLSLVTMAMWSLLQDKTRLTEEDLLERVRTLDLMDGNPDGKATVTVSKCRKCDRTMAPRHRKCIYCGAARPVGSAFDTI